MNLPVKQFTERDLARARSRGKIVGWLQGGGAVIAGGVILNFIGWIPSLIVLAGVIYVLYKILTRTGKDEGED